MRMGATCFGRNSDNFMLTATLQFTTPRLYTLNRRSGAAYSLLCCARKQPPIAHGSDVDAHSPVSSCLKRSGEVVK